MQLPDRATKILVVEDEQIIAYSIQRSLIKSGYLVPATANSAEEAFEQIERTAPDLVLMDIHIQGEMDGVEAAGVIKERHHLPVIYLTAHADSATLERAKLTEPLGYLTKPLNHANLPAAIEVALFKHATERHVAEQKALLSTILQTIAEAVIVTNPRGDVQFLNRAAEALTGWNEIDACGKSLDSLIALQSACGNALLPRCLADARTMPIPREATLRTRSGMSLPVDGQIAISQTDGRIAGAMITLHDATVRLGEERQIRQEQKMLSVGRLASDIAHDFYGLFDLIARSGEELRDNKDEEDSVEYSANLITQAGDAGAAMARQLLEFGKNQTLRPEPLSLNQILEERKPLYERLCGNAISVETLLAEDLKSVLSHSIHLEKLALNLVLGAKHAMPGGGKILLSTSNVLHSPEEGGIEKPYVRLAIRSQRKEGADRLPAASNTTNPELTLAIVNTIVSVAEGSVSTTHQNDLETTTEVLLPALITAEEQFIQDFGYLQPTVLTVGLDAGAQNFEERLEQLGFVVMKAPNAQEAIQLSETCERPISLLVIDSAVIPTLSQRRIYTIVSSRFKDVKLLSLCLNEKPANLPATFLRKPFDMRDLVDAATSLVRSIPPALPKPA